METTRVDIVFATEHLMSGTESEHKVIAVGVFEGGQLTKQAALLDRMMGGYLSKALMTSPFKAKRGTVLSLVVPSVYDRVVLVGLGGQDGLSALEAQKIGGAVIAQMNQDKVKSAAVALAGNKLMLTDADLVANVGYGARLRGYSFDKYRTKRKPEEVIHAERLFCLVEKEPDDAALVFERLEHVADGVFLTRDLVNEPANVVHPDSFPSYCKALAAHGVEVEVLGEDEMRSLGMFSLLGVGQGSEHESRLIIMRWNGAGKDDQPVAFVGKGVTFDTGGISIKPAGGMEEMKWDMAGAGVVTGLMKALALRKAKVNAVGVIGVVENMPSGTAQRPGDVVVSMSGQTIEVINTDAEGRLVLADALWYTQDRFKPQFMIDLATLTGAIIICLGHEKAGLFSNNDQLSGRIEEAAEAVGEPVWRLPLGKEYDEQINCDIADMKNVGDGRGAGSITAAQFLQRFVNDLPWAHLDIAGVAWAKKDQAITPKGATAFGVRLLDQLVARHYEGK